MLDNLSSDQGFSFHVLKNKNLQFKWQILPLLSTKFWFQTLLKRGNDLEEEENKRFNDWNV